MKDVNFIIKRRDIFYANLGKGIGSEQSDVRPVLIIQNDIGNRYSPTIIIAPITSNLDKAKVPTHVSISNGIGLNKNSVVLLEQVRTIDKKRLTGYVGKCNVETMEQVDRALKISVGVLNTYEEEIKKQADEIVYWERSLEELKLDSFASVEQIEQRELRLDFEILKLENMCKEKNVYINRFYDKNNRKYNNLNSKIKKTIAI